VTSRTGTLQNTASNDEPEDGVHFCGERSSIDAQGCLEGPMETGERAADEIISALR